MLGSSTIVGFIPTTNADRSRKFFVETLGLTFVADEEYGVVLTSGANTIRLVKLEKHEPSEFAILGWETTNIEKTVREMTAAGVTIERYDFIEQDDLGIWSAPDRIAKVAWFKDPDGNVLSVSQHG